MDGGSDWVCLYRDFARYIIMEKDELLLGLRAFYKYTLLPAEVRDVVGVLDLPGLVTGPVGYLVFLYLLVVWCFFLFRGVGNQEGSV